MVAEAGLAIVVSGTVLGLASMLLYYRGAIQFSPQNWPRKLSPKIFQKTLQKLQLRNAKK